MRKFGLRNGVAKFFYSLELDHSKGMRILTKPNSPLRAETVELDINGRFIILLLKSLSPEAFEAFSSKR